MSFLFVFFIHHRNAVVLSWVTISKSAATDRLSTLVSVQALSNSCLQWPLVLLDLEWLLSLFFPDSFEEMLRPSFFPWASFAQNHPVFSSLMLLWVDLWLSDVWILWLVGLALTLLLIY